LSVELRLLDKLITTLFTIIIDGAIKCGWLEENITRTIMNFKIVKDFDKTAMKTNHQV